MAQIHNQKGKDTFERMEIIADSTASTNDVKSFYNKWAESYVEDIEAADYLGPRLGAEKLSQLIPEKKNTRIIDCGCGTGMVAVECFKLGFKDIDGIDLSQKSLDVCKSKNVYTKLICDELGEHRLDIPDNSYNGIVSIGTFIPGHVNQCAFPEFIRIVKPGGFIVIGMREEFIEMGTEFQNGQLEEAMQKMVDAKRWEWIEREIIPQFFAGKSGISFVFKVL